MGLIATNRFKKVLKPKAAKAESQRITDPNVFSERVAKKAYELYLERGCVNGRDVDDWLEAERIVEKEMISGG
jgi:hypothetical protein